MTSRRVTWVMTRPNVGGPARLAMVMAKTLPARGYEFDLLTGTESADEGRLTDGMTVQTIPGLQQPISPLHDLRAARALGSRLREARPDVVHTHTAKAGALGRRAARKAGVPVVVHTFHGHVLDGYFSGPMTRLITGAERRMARRTDALVAVSPEIRDELLALGIGRPEQWRLIPLGLDLHDLVVSKPDRVAARRSLGLPDQGPIVGTVGRLVEIKDIDCFLSAAASVAASVPDATFVIAGDGALRDRLKSRASSLLGNRVRFTGWVFDLPILYAAMDIVVLTSKNEGTPTTLIEAGAAGRPVVATSVGGVPHVVQDGVTGLLVPPSDPAAVAAMITKLLHDEPLADSLGDAAREHVTGRFGAERAADETAALYSELLERNGAAMPETSR